MNGKKILTTKREKIFTSFLWNEKCYLNLFPWNINESCPHNQNNIWKSGIKKLATFYSFWLKIFVSKTALGKWDYTIRANPNKSEIQLATREALVKAAKATGGNGFGLTRSLLLHMSVWQQATPHLVTLTPGILSTYFLTPSGPQFSVSSLEQRVCKEKSKVI